MSDEGFQQPFMFPPTNGTETSRMAAESVANTAAAQRATVLKAVREWTELAGGATREQLEVYTGIQGNSIRPRVDELRRLRMVEEIDEMRKTRSGRMAKVLRALPA
jgi:hypothetical protein